MFGWLKRKNAPPSDRDWLRAEQKPGTAFPFPKGAKLRPEEDVMLALPTAIIGENETIGSIILCDKDAELALNDDLGVWYIKLKAGMTFELAKSCEVMLIAKDSRPRFFSLLPPPDKKV